MSDQGTRIKFWDKKVERHGIYAKEIVELQSIWARERRKKIIKKHLLKSGRVLDVGCGEGNLTQMIREINSATFGTDHSINLLHACRIKYNLSNLAQSSITSIPFKEETFDLVCCTEVLQYIQDVDKAISELSRILKVNGKLILLVPNHNFFPYQRRIAKGEDLTNKSRMFILHKNNTYLNALKQHNIKIEKILKMPFNFLPLAFGCSLAFIGVKNANN